jgi:hypothetical protein
LNKVNYLFGGILEHIMTTVGKTLYFCSREDAGPLSKKMAVKHKVLLAPADEDG